MEAEGGVESQPVATGCEFLNKNRFDVSVFVFERCQELKHARERMAALVVEIVREVLSHSLSFARTGCW